MKKYSYYLDEDLIELAKTYLVPYEKESDFVRYAIQAEVERRRLYRIETQKNNPSK